MTALKRIKANTIEKRLLNARGEPNFGINFYILNKKGEHAGVGDVRRRHLRRMRREGPETRQARAAARRTPDGGLRTEDRGLSMRAFVILNVVAGALVVGVGAQGSKMYQVGGGARDGVSAFPRVDYAQLKPSRPARSTSSTSTPTRRRRRCCGCGPRAYPDLVELYSVGQSFEGREIWQITITNKKTGKDTDKPAFFIEGGRHAGEITGIEATLYFVNHVLTNYGNDPGDHEARRHEGPLREAEQQPRRRVALSLHGPDAPVSVRPYR